jgi:hypothetical protein
MRPMSKTLLTATLVLGLGACESTTGPSGTATLQVAAQGDSGGPSTSSIPLYTERYTSADGQTEGTVEFRARVYVRSSVNASQWVEVTNQAAQRVRVDASGRQGATTFATAQVDAHSYNRVRVVFEEVKADVTGGIRIGTGLLTGEIRVDLGGSGETVVERNIDVTLSEGTSATLVIDLNTDAWLSRADAQSRTVSRAEFESAVRLFATNKE